MSDHNQFVNLRQIDQRLTKLEHEKHEHDRPKLHVETKQEKTNFLSKIEDSKKHEQEEVISKVHAEAKQSFLVNKKNTGRLLDLIEFTVEFVENVVTYVPDIVQVVGSALKGELKLGLALDLITDLASEVADSVAPVALPDLVEKVVDLKYHPEKGISRNEIETSNFHMSPSVNVGKKNYFLFSLRLKKKRENEINLRI